MNAPIIVAGETVELRPLTVGILAQVLPLLAPILEAGQADSEPGWLHALEANIDRLTNALAIAFDRPVEWVNGLSYGDFIDLSRSVFLGYADYLRRTALPNVMGEG